MTAEAKGASAPVGETTDAPEKVRDSEVKPDRSDTPESLGGKVDAFKRRPEVGQS